MILMADEIWKPVVGYEGRYEISDLGRLRSVSRYVPSGFQNLPDGMRRVTGRILKTRIRRRYPAVGLWSHELKKTDFAVASLVMLTFVGPRPDGMQVCHQNGNRDDPRLINLRYDTPKGNAADKTRHGTDSAGEKNAAAKLRREDADQIRMMRGMVRQRDIGVLFGISQAQVSKIMLGDRWK